MKNWLKRSILQFRTFTLQGLFCWVSMRLNGKEVLVTGSCHGCGTCCSSVCLEGKNGWLRSEKEFAVVVNSHPEYRRFAVTGTDANGFLLFRCSWLTREGCCADHDNRLPLCRNFPDRSLVFSGGQLPAHCGYTFSAVVPFKKILDHELEKKK